jgi:hypothetical protein
MKQHVFAPGCALAIYRPHVVYRLLERLRDRFGDVDLSLACCHHTPQSVVGKRVINVCPGCDRRYRENYKQPDTVSLWEVLAESGDFIFPDHGGKRMTIIDACPTRDQTRVHAAVRTLAERMGIEIVEPLRTREESTCCGDSFYGDVSKEKVLNAMRAKARSMPEDDVLVYCVSCSKSMFNGGLSPYYLVDLLFDEATTPGTLDPDEWHAELDEFMETHTGEEGTR